jgi:hypothetical protein
VTKSKKVSTKEQRGRQGEEPCAYAAAAAHKIDLWIEAIKKDKKKLLKLNLMDRRTKIA